MRRWRGCGRWSNDSDYPNNPAWLVLGKRRDQVFIDTPRSQAADFGKLLADDTEKWARVIKFVP
jgi:hypothetical protein